MVIYRVFYGIIKSSSNIMNKHNMNIVHPSYIKQIVIHCLQVTSNTQEINNAYISNIKTNMAFYPMFYDIMNCTYFKHSVFMPSSWGGL